MRVKFNNPEIKPQLVPVYYDEDGLVHHMNYLLTESSANENAYLMLGTHDNFGFGVENVSK